MKPKRTKQILEIEINNRDQIIRSQDSEKNKLLSQVTARGIEIEDLRKQLTWHRNMNQNMMMVIETLGKNK